MLCNTGSLETFPSSIPNVTQDISITNQRITTIPKYVNIYTVCISPHQIPFHPHSYNFFVILACTVRQKNTDTFFVVLWQWTWRNFYNSRIIFYSFAAFSDSKFNECVVLLSACFDMFSLLKWQWQCNEIFFPFCSWIEPTKAPNKQTKMVLLKDPFSRRYSRAWKNEKKPFVTLPL